jgi:hypothetical protein
MKLYHGSPKKLKVLVPKQGKGINKFESQKAIFLTSSFKQSALYAISKSLKGRTAFALPPNKLIIVGDFKPKSGYVYEVNVEAQKGLFGEYEYAYRKRIRKFIIHKVKPSEYKSDIFYVKDKKELINKLR